MTTSKENDVIPDIQASLLCDDVRQERNGKFILIGLFDVVGVPTLPSVFQRVCIVNRWCCGSGTFEQKSKIIKPDGNTALIEGKPVKIRLPHAEATATSVEFFVNARFEDEGTYWIEVYLEGDLKLRYPLRVKVVENKTKEN